MKNTFVYSPLRIRIFFVSTLLILSLSSYAQLTGGVKGGANLLYSDWDIPGQTEKYSGISYHFGAYGNLHLAERMALQTEVLYNSFKIDFSGETLTANYISVPILFSYSFFNHLLAVHAGPQVSFLLSADPDDLDRAIGNSEISMMLGTGVTFKRFNITLRYGLGVTNLASDEVKQFFPEASIKNNTLQLSLAFQLFGKVK